MSDKTNYIPPNEQTEDNINELLHTDTVFCNKNQLFKELTDNEIDNIENIYLDENGYINPPF